MGGFATPESTFLAVGLVVGSIFVAVTPPFEGADEPAHFYRAYQISSGGWRAERAGDRVGGVLPAALRPHRPQGAPIVQAGEREFIDFRTTAPYSPIAYLPQALAIGVGRVLAVSPVGLLYCARLAGLSMALGLIYLAIRSAPMAKHVLLLLALSPMGLRQMALLTADSLTIAYAFLFIAIVLHLTLVSGAARQSVWIGALTACAVALTLAKLAYAPMVLLVLICPPAQFRDPRRHRAVVLGVLGVSALAAIAWLVAIRDLYVPQPIAPDADPARQVAFILSHPLRYAGILYDDLRRNLGGYVFACLGYAGHVPWLFGWAHIAALSGVALLDCGRPRPLEWRAKLVLLAVAIATYALINTLNYLGWSPVGAPRIGFIQGRYYLPIAPLLFLLLSNRRLPAAVAQQRLTLWAGFLALAVALITLYGLARRWYGL
jgi:uncharacterized membrane protein